MTTALGPRKVSFLTILLLQIRLTRVISVTMSQKQWFAHLGISASDCTENSKTLKWNGVFAPLRSTATISTNFVGDPIPGMIHIAMFDVVSMTCAIRLRVFTLHYFPFLLQYYLVCSAGRKILFGMKQAFLNIYYFTAYLL